MNSLGQSLGLTTSEIVQLIKELESENRIEIRWGGEIKLASRPRSGIDVGNNSVVVVNSHLGGVRSSVQAPEDCRDAEDSHSIWLRNR